jgi:hypothetical protein
MNTDTTVGELASAARQELAGLLQAVERGRASLEEIHAQHRRLGFIKQAEASAKAKLDAIRERDARDLSDQLVNPAGLHITVDHTESAEAELELARATREADVARACEPEVTERLMQSGRRLAELQASVPERAAEVMLEEAAEIIGEIDADAAKLRAKYARLWGLRAFLGDAKLYRPLERMAAPIHPDNVCPSPAEVNSAAPVWAEVASRLATDPAACLDDQE